MADQIDILAQQRVHPDGTITFDLFTAPLTLQINPPATNNPILTLYDTGAEGAELRFHTANAQVAIISDNNEPSGLELIDRGVGGGGGAAAYLKVMGLLASSSYADVAAPGAGNISVGGATAGFTFFDRGGSGFGFVLYQPSQGVARLFYSGVGDLFGWYQTANQAALTKSTINTAPALAGKHAAAGDIGYEAYTAGALDIVGAGTAGNNRIVKIWDFLQLATGAALASMPRGSIAIDGSNGNLLYLSPAGNTRILGAGP